MDAASWSGFVHSSGDASQVKAFPEPDSADGMFSAYSNREGNEGPCAVLELAKDVTAGAGSSGFWL